MFETKIFFKGSHEGIGHALLSFVRDGEPLGRVQKPRWPLGNELLAIAVGRLMNI